MSAAIVLQLIAVLNVVALIVARGVSRRPERALRAALGTSRFRLWRETMAEVFCIVGSGWLVGMIAAWICSPSLVAFLAPGVTFPAWWEISIDWSEAGYTLALTAAIVTIFATLPLWKATAVTLDEQIRGLAPGRGISLFGRRFRDVAIVLQFIIAVPLLMGATLSIMNVRTLSQTPLGIDPTNIGQVMVTSVNRTPEQHLADMKTLQTRVEEHADILAVGFGDAMPGSLSGGGTLSANYQLPDGASASLSNVTMHSGSANLPSLFGISLLHGRWLQPADSNPDTLGVLIDTTFAERAFGTEPPIGQRVARLMRPGQSEQIWGTVVGVVSPTRRTVFKNYAPSIYFPGSQLHTSNNIYFKSRGAPGLLVPKVIETIESLGPHIFTTLRFGDYREAIDLFIWQSRFVSRLLTAFGLIALLIITLGLVATVAYSVAQRHHEIGVRMALGAQPIRIVRQFVRDGLSRAVLGTLLGLAICLSAADWADSLFSKVSTRDLSTYAMVVMVLIVISALASFWPAKKATAIDPIECLRAE